MKKIIIFENINNIKSKREALDFLEETKKLVREYEEIVILPSILFLLFLKENYSGKKIKFACLTDDFSEKTISIINTFNVNHLFLKNYRDFPRLPEPLYKKNNLILKISSSSEDEKGIHLDKIRDEVLKIHQKFKINGKLGFSKIYLVYSKDMKTNKFNMINFERDVLFIKKVIYDAFGANSRKVKVLYSVDNEGKHNFIDIPFLDGLFVSC